MKAATAAHSSYSENHNSHKHNWDFIECKTTGSKLQFLKESTSGGETEFTFSQSSQQDIRSFLPALFFLLLLPVQASLSRSSLSLRRAALDVERRFCFCFYLFSFFPSFPMLRTGTLLPADAANGCLQPASSERKQQEEACIVKNPNRWR